MATDLNAGPWDSMDEAVEKGGEVVKAACREAGGSVHGWVAVERPSDGKWGVRGLFTTRILTPGHRWRSTSHYVKAGIDVSCGHPKRYIPQQDIPEPVIRCSRCGCTVLTSSDNRTGRCTGCEEK